jgi:hypothetical protein
VDVHYELVAVSPRCSAPFINRKRLSDIIAFLQPSHSWCCSWRGLVSDQLALVRKGLPCVVMSASCFVCVSAVCWSADRPSFQRDGLIAVHLGASLLSPCALWFSVYSGCWSPFLGLASWM